MRQRLENVISSRIIKLISKFANKEYRSEYIGSHLKEFLAGQIRQLRLQKDLSQTEFANLLKTTQSVVSRLEDPNYGKATLQTLLDIANKLDVALIVRFVDFPRFLKLTDDFSEAALGPQSYNQASMDALAKEPLENEKFNKPPYMTATFAPKDSQQPSGFFNADYNIQQTTQPTTYLLPTYH